MLYFDPLPYKVCTYMCGGTANKIKQCLLRLSIRLPTSICSWPTLNILIKLALSSLSTSLPNPTYVHILHLVTDSTQLFFNQQTLCERS
jgi:hypothetical protein